MEKICSSAISKTESLYELLVVQGLQEQFGVDAHCINI